MVLQSYRCVSYDDSDIFEKVKAQRVLFADPNVECGSKSYVFMVIYASVNVVIWPVGVPLGITIWLNRISRYLNPPGIPEAQAIVERQDHKHVVNSAVAFLALRYKPRYWYFEMLDVARRLMLTCFVLVFDSLGMFVMFVLAVSITSTVAEREMGAHRDKLTRKFVYLMSWQIVLCALGMLLMDAEMTNTLSETLLGILLLGINLVLIFAVCLDLHGDIVDDEKKSRGAIVQMISRGLSKRFWHAWSDAVEDNILENESCEVKESLEEVSNPLTTFQRGNETRSRGNALCEADEGLRAQGRDEEQGNDDDNGGDGGEEGGEVAVLEMRALDSQRAMGATIDGTRVVLDAGGAEGYHAEEYIPGSALHPSSHGDAKQQEFDLLASPVEESKGDP